MVSSTQINFGEFKVSKEIKNQIRKSFEEIKKTLRERNFRPLINNLDFDQSYEDLPDFVQFGDGEKKIYVTFVGLMGSDGQKGKSITKRYIDYVTNQEFFDVKKGKKYDIIMVSNKNTIHSTAKLEMMKIKHSLKIEIFNMEDLLYPIDHFLQPESFKFLRRGEDDDYIKSIMETHYIGTRGENGEFIPNEHIAPKISETDRIARYGGVQSGDVVEFIRQGGQPFWRFVK